MRIGVNYQLKYSTPEDWIACLRSLGAVSYTHLIVQPISYVEITDNVSSENSVGATCGQAPAAAERHTAISSPQNRCQAENTTTAQAPSRFSFPNNLSHTSKQSWRPETDRQLCLLFHLVRKSHQHQMDRQARPILL